MPVSVADHGFLNVVKLPMRMPGMIEGARVSPPFCAGGKAASPPDDQLRNESKKGAQKPRQRLG